MRLLSRFVGSTCIGALVLLGFQTSALGQHALTADVPLPAAAEGCNLCHGAHDSGSGSRHMLRSGQTLSTGVQAPGLDRVSGSCLRCHTSPAIRSSQPEFRGSAPGVSGGAYLQMDLGDDHSLGIIDPGSVLAEPRLSASMRPGLGAASASLLNDGGALRIGCTTCHDPHDRNGSLPSLEDERFLCESCHDPARYAYDRHEELPCSSCHAVHAGHGRELFNRPTADEVCTGCHGPGATGGAPSFEAMASRRARLYGAVVPPVSPSGHLTPPEGRCVDCHPVHR
jgi:predicted CXXCH cytochrome family protein